jgi:GNAT superfamily N-acetyltransferase
VNDLTTRPLQKADLDHIVSVIDRWWGGPTSALAHPIYFYELGQLARVVEYEGHMVGIHPDFRRRGVARLLYSSFENDCRKAGAKSMKAITTMGNEGSVRFHEAVGWSVKEVEHYAGRDRHRIVFTKSLDGN